MGRIAGWAWLFAMLGATASAQSCVTASQVTLTGTLRASNGLPSANDTITLQPSQVGIVAGCGVNTQSTMACATSVDGSVVQTPNPPVPAVTSTTGTGTLPSGTYYVEFAWYDALGHVTLASPEVVQALSVQGSLVVSPPASGVPATAAGMNVYVGSSSGGETLQGQTTGTASYNQGVALTTGTALPTVNTTTCVATANDSIWPVGTGYVVNMADANGNALPGYPMQWQLTGAGTTINLSNGLPYYHGVVFYPTPVLTAPTGHATQSISGSVNLTGYNLLNAGKIGVGTSLPAWPIDVENGWINGNLGLLLNGATGTAGQCLLSGGSAGPDTWGTCATVYYQTVASNGTAQTQRPTLNFSSRFALGDSSSPAETNVDLANSGVTAGSYTSPSNVTVDGYGRVTSVTASSAVSRVCTGVGGYPWSCYRVEQDGTIEEWGATANVANGSNYATAAISFPHAFTTVGSIATTLTPDNCSGGGGTFCGTDVVTEANLVGNSLTVNGFTAYVGAGVPTGGGGGNLNPTIHVNWRATGY